jgi:uncharacterized membrane protein
MKISPALALMLKGLGLTVLLAVLAFFSNAANLNGVLPEVVVGIIALVASRIESTIKEGSGKALFGAARVR